jgi:type IV secretory pathway VirB2 component (pilin)
VIVAPIIGLVPLARALPAASLHVAGSTREDIGARVPDVEPPCLRRCPMPVWSRLSLTRQARVKVVTLIVLAAPSLAFAQQSPWERAAANLEATFTGPLARSLALVAIVIGGLLFMFGEGGAKRQISGIVFGGGLALFAAQFLAWLF